VKYILPQLGLVYNPSLPGAHLASRPNRESLAGASSYAWPQDDLHATWQLDRLIGDEFHAYLNRCAAWRRRYEKHYDRR